MRYWAELAGYSVELARRELEAVLRTLGSASPEPRPVAWGERVVAFDTDRIEEVARRLAFTHRLLLPLTTGTLADLAAARKEEGKSGRTGALRPASGNRIPDEWVVTLGRSFVQGGGKVDLEDPERAYVLHRGSADPESLALSREVARTARLSLCRRKAADLPFRKPVTLTPLLARGLVNLAACPPGGRILDPFCGTGALLIEAGNLGYRVIAADKDSRMVKGTLTNLAHFSLDPAALTQTDIDGLAAALEDHFPVDAIVTDPPYGRASSTHGEEAEQVVERAFLALRPLVRPGGRLVLMLPVDYLPGAALSEWTLEFPPIPLRVHASLTRWVFALTPSPSRAT